MYCPNCSEPVSEKAEICPNCGVRPFRVINHCYHCGSSVGEHQEFCVECGVSLKKKPSGSAAGDKEPWLMALLSFFLPGLGQIIIGQVAKGATMMGAGIFLAIISSGFFWFVVIPVAVIDAYQIARKKQEGKTVDDWEFF